jgi:hypothetical protein
MENNKRTPQCQKLLLRITAVFLLLLVDQTTPDCTTKDTNPFRRVLSFLKLGTQNRDSKCKGPLMQPSRCKQATKMFSFYKFE